MHAHFVFLVAHAPERIEHGRIGNGRASVADGGEKACSLARVLLKFPKNGYCLSEQGHKMLTAHFHAFGRDAPFPGLKANSFHWAARSPVGRVKTSGASFKVQTSE